MVAVVALVALIVGFGAVAIFRERPAQQGRSATRARRGVILATVLLVAGVTCLMLGTWGEMRPASLSGCRPQNMQHPGVALFIGAMLTPSALIAFAAQCKGPRALAVALYAGGVLAFPLAFLWLFLEVLAGGMNCQ